MLSQLIYKIAHLLPYPCANHHVVEWETRPEQPTRQKHLIDPQDDEKTLCRLMRQKWNILKVVRSVTSDMKLKAFQK